MTISLADSQFDDNAFWTNALLEHTCPSAHSVALFDQNGYDLSELEIMYSKVNANWHSMHRNYTHIALKNLWFVQEPEVEEGAVLNHALLFERKGYAGAALEQLETWAQQIPLFYKVARYRPKWGLDFSIDWADTQCNVFEIFHYEFDSFDYTEIQQVKSQLEPMFLNQDWKAAAKELLRRKQEWHDLDFFGQSDYKCAFFGLPSERFKMVAWQ
jgi:hypothetical protein